MYVISQSKGQDFGTTCMFVMELRRPNTVNSNKDNSFEKINLRKNLRYIMTYLSIIWKEL